MKTYAYVLCAMLAGAAVAADAPMATDSTKAAAPVKKHHKAHKKAMADSTAMAAPADTTAAPAKKHHKKLKKLKKHKKAAMADSSSMSK
jgi:hypothetical protein